MEIIKKRFGEQLKALRKIKNYTQEALSEAIEINLRQLARIEAGESFVSAETLYKICKTLKISPQILFDFDIEKNGILPVETDNRMHFYVTKNKNNLVLKIEYDENLKEIKEKAFDSKMLLIAQRLQKEIYVNEVEDKIETCVKLYTPKGEINIINNRENNYKQLKNKIDSISEDKKKIEYMNLAFESLNNKDALKELKSLIRGIELTQE